MWEPILEAGAAERAGLALDAIAEALRDPPPPYDGRIDDPGVRVSLVAHEPGYALFLAYLARVLPGGGHDELAGQFLDVAIDHVPLIATTRPYFAFGLAGCAWALEHLRGSLLDADDDPLADVDDAIATLIETVPQASGLRNGLTGYAIYMLERSTPRSTECLVEIARVLDQSALRANGTAWWGEDRVDPGALEGVIGPVAVLAAIGRRTGASVGVADEAVEWLRGQLVGEPRLAWCTGHLGIATALFAAGRSAGKPAWCELAHDVALAAARREVEVDDACLCHGAAGIGHAFNRLYQATRDEVLQDAARRWFATSLRMFEPGRGLGGFLFRFPEEDRDRMPELRSGWVSELGMLKGAAGVGLALLAATTAIEPAWDRCLLLSSR